MRGEEETRTRGNNRRGGEQRSVEKGKSTGDKGR